MPKKFDAELKILTTGHIDEWARFLCPRVEVPPGPAEALNTDLSANVQADRLFRVNGSVPAVLHLEFESSGRLGRATRFFRYNLLAHIATGLPVHTAVILLRPEADSSDMTGRLAIAGAHGKPYATFDFYVIRLWKESIDSLLAAGPGTAPLAVLTDEAARDVPAAYDRVHEHLHSIAKRPDTLKDLLGSAALLGSMRYDESMLEFVQRRLSMSIDLRDSSIYRRLLREGEERGLVIGEKRGAVRSAQDILLGLGRVQFKSAPAKLEKSIRSIDDPNRLQRMAERLLKAKGLDDVLGTK